MQVRDRPYAVIHDLAYEYLREPMWLDELLDEIGGSHLVDHHGIGAGESATLLDESIESLDEEHEVYGTDSCWTGKDDWAF